MSAMGSRFAGVSGKSIEASSTVVMGVNSEGNSKIFAFDGMQKRFRGLEVPQGMTLWNYSSIVHFSTKELFITGGLSANASEISSEAYIYDISANRAVRLPDMGSPRYTHIGTFFKGKLYAIGGRDYGEDDDTAIRINAERFNFSLHKWEKIAKLNIPRCTGFTFIYKDSIYVCGGLTGKKRRSRTVERYDESRDLWEVIDFKLARGIECGSLLPSAMLFGKDQPNTFVILGGNTEEGAQDSCFIYDIVEKTVISGPSLAEKRVL